MCGRDRLPIVWIQDTTGIDVGDPAEKAELLGLGQSLIYSIQNAKVPQMEITLRKGTAAAHYVMSQAILRNLRPSTFTTASTMTCLPPRSAGIRRVRTRKAFFRD